MTVPSWWELLLLALAAYRVWRLVAVDDILEPWRGRILGRLPSRMDEFVGCAWCSGFWVALAWWGAFEIWPHWALVLAAPWATAAAAAIIAAHAEPG